MSARAVGRHLTLAAVASFLVCGVTANANGMTDEEGSSELPTPEVTMNEFDPQDFSSQAAEFPPALADAIERDLDISPERYLARAAAAKVAADVVASLGDIVHAAWLDARTLHIAVKERADEPLAAATGARVHVGDALTDAAQAAREQGSVVYIDRAAERVVPLESDLVGEPRQTSKLSAETDSMDDPELLGGYGYWTDDPGASYQCTAGFNGVDDDGHPRTLTAGHCQLGESDLLSGPINLLSLPLLDDDDESETGDAGLGGTTGVDESEEPGTDEQPRSFGAFDPDSSHFGDGNDAALLDINNDEWTTRPEVAGPAGNGSQGAGLAIYDSIAPIAGAPVCQTGATSGWTCGTILEASSTFPVGGEDVTGFMMDACTLPGDGGGPLVVGPYALGISSGTTWTTTDCEEQDAEDGPNVAVGYRLSAEGNSADALYGDDWNLSVHVGTPNVDSPVEGDVTGERPTFRGTIEAAAGATVVVTVDGAEPVEATVLPDGRWSAPISDALTPGRHSYSVTATHTPHTADDPTVSDTVNGTFEVAKVASLVVLSPSSGEKITNSQPHFMGTGDPGAQITLLFGDQTTTTVVNEDGTWEVSPPPAPRAGRFDAVVKQEVDGATDDVSVDGLGIVPGAPLINRPERKLTSGDTVTGTGLPDSTVAVRIQPEQTGDSTETDSSTETGDSTEAAPAAEHIAQTDGGGAWEVELSSLEAGSYTVTAVQAIDDLTSERSAAVTLVVAGPSSQHLRSAEVDEDDLAQTGITMSAPVLVGLALAGLGCLALAVRNRLPASRS